MVVFRSPDSCSSAQDPRIRADRLLGWVELRDFDILATARAVRTLHDARRYGGLLSLAIKQLHFNWESARNEVTWYGELLGAIRSVWPRFSLQCFDEIRWSGAPASSAFSDSKDNLGRLFSQAVCQLRWYERQTSLLTFQPGSTRQDHFLYMSFAFRCRWGST